MKDLSITPKKELKNKVHQLPVNIDDEEEEPVVRRKGR